MISTLEIWNKIYWQLKLNYRYYRNYHDWHWKISNNLRLNIQVVISWIGVSLVFFDRTNVKYTYSNLSDIDPILSRQESILLRFQPKTLFSPSLFLSLWVFIIPRNPMDFNYRVSRGIPSCSPHKGERERERLKNFSRDGRHIIDRAQSRDRGRRVPSAGAHSPSSIFNDPARNHSNEQANHRYRPRLYRTYLLQEPASFVYVIEPDIKCNEQVADDDDVDGALMASLPFASRGHSYDNAFAASNNVSDNATTFLHLPIYCAKSFHCRGSCFWIGYEYCSAIKAGDARLIWRLENIRIISRATDGCHSSGLLAAP